MLQTLIYGLAGFGCAAIVYLITRCLVKTWQDLLMLDQMFWDDDEW